MSPIHDIIANAKQLMQKLPMPMYIIDTHDTIFWMNDMFQRQFGSDSSIWDTKLATLIFNEKEMATPIIINGKEGTKICSRLQLTPVHDRDSLIAYTGILQIESTHNFFNDVERYKIAADNTSDIIVLVDNQSIVRYVSPSILATTGYTFEQYEGMDAFEPLHPDDRERVRLSHLQAIQTKEEVNLEYRFVHQQGSIIHLETRVKPVLDQFGGVKYVVAVVRDITERKKTEQLLENILDSVNAAVWSTDKDFSYYSFCSDSIEKVTGIPRKEIMNNPIRLHDHIHHDDNEMLMGEVKHDLDQGKPVNKIIRYIHVENETRWGRLIVHPYLNNQGEVERLDGLILDITDKKRTELALEESEQRYKSLFENNLDGVFSIDLKGYFVNANVSFEKITQIEKDLLPNLCFIGLIYDEDQQSVYQVLSNVIRFKEPRDIECRIVRSFNGERIVHITFVPIFFFGELNGVHGIVKDITDRKREEQELIQSEERYKFLQQSMNRFSNDLSNVMKVADLENRLIVEVNRVLPVNHVSIDKIIKKDEPEFDDKNTVSVKIGEKEHPIYLNIELTQKLLKIEKEWLETAIHYVTILYDNLQFIEDLMERLENIIATNETPKWMLRLLFKLSEKERASLSSDLHDSVLQDLIIWYRKLESLRTTTSFNEETNTQLSQIEEGLLDAIHQIRITCNELRPPFLLKMGLVESLKSLFSYARMFSNYEIEFTANNMNRELNEEQILGIYRIVQELLNNASKHSNASLVTMLLEDEDECIHFSYNDNGLGTDIAVHEGSFINMGIAGMKNRVLSLEGEMKIKSFPQKGFHVDIYIPFTSKQKGEYYENIIS
ncbi:sensor histidine kinase [Neobacillus sp. D3-1R]|uniref:sensor histidine kinase n=1 Tax=Neobacillus sp. D3-1R TaxID=3445778 RepID=UPI003F9F0E3E